LWSWKDGFIGLRKEGTGRHIGVLIYSVNEQTPDEITELAAGDRLPADVAALQPETALDDLTTATHETGNTILRRVLQAR